MKLGHIGLPVNDIAESKAFYDVIAPHVGLARMDVYEDFVGYGNDGSYRFYLQAGKAPVTNLHLCFEVDSREAVELFHKAALEAGGIDNGAPGIRKHYSPTYYASFVIDPDGNNIEAMCRN